MARAASNKYMQSKQAKESAALSAPVRRSDALGVMDAFLKTTTGKGIDAMIEEHIEAELRQVRLGDVTADFGSVYGFSHLLPDKSGCSDPHSGQQIF